MIQSEQVLPPNITAYEVHPSRKSRIYIAFKLVFDVTFALVCVPFLLLATVFLVFANPWANPGPLFFVQKRMGRNGKPFYLYKFRSMLCEKNEDRGPDDPLEVHRITKLGACIRRLRIDELPQVINLLKGDMSFIGPRPDMYEHSVEYLRSVPGYHRRFAVKPGITGLAQTQVGYVEGVAGTRRKVLADIKYIARRSVSLDLWIFWRTVQTVFKSAGR